MTNDTKENNLNQELSTIERVFERIEAEAITPTPKIKFLVTEWGIWLVWVMTVLFGATALAITLYTTLSAQYAFYEATHHNFLTFMVAIVPYIWIVLFALMTYISVYEIKNTKRGYRYNTIVILSSNIFFTFLGAILLHYLGLGYTLDHKLGEQIGMYMSLEKKEQRVWQKPTAGRLLGTAETAVDSAVGEMTIIRFEDSHGDLWQLNINELNNQELALLNQALPVRLLGTTTGDFSFHVCGVFPWLHGRAMPRREMQEQRAEFDALMHYKISKIDDLDEKFRHGEHQNVSNNSLCASLPIMKRMR